MGRNGARTFGREFPNMELDLEGNHRDRANALITSLVTPWPIAWVTIN
jgi:hypothetical protein